MVRLIRILMFFCSAILLTSCLTAGHITHKFDFNTGQTETEYFDIGTTKGMLSDTYSPKDDFLNVMDIVNNYDELHESDPDVVEPGIREVFQDNNVLSGIFTSKVICPKCFVSKAALLELLHENYIPYSGVRKIEIIRDEIFLFLSSNKIALSSNGQIFKTENNHIIVWPVSTEVFEFSFTEYSASQSLLPYYLESQNNQEE